MISNTNLAGMISAIYFFALPTCILAANSTTPTANPDAAAVTPGANGTISHMINVPNAALTLDSNKSTDVEFVQPTSPEEEKKVIQAIVEDLQNNFATKYQEMIKEILLPGGEYPVRGYSASNGIELNGKMKGLENIKLSKAFEASASKSLAGLTAYNVKAEMEIPELAFDFDLVKYFPIDVFKLFPVRGYGRANMTAYLPLETKTTPTSQATTAGCIAAVDAVARADNVRVDVVFTNALGRGLQWIRDNLHLDLADSVLSNFAKTIVDVVMSILQLIICGAIEAATKAVVAG